jgi:hypothetical protein
LYTAVSLLEFNPTHFCLNEFLLVLQLLVLQPKVTKEDQEGASLLTLIRDPYILVAAGALTFANAGNEIVTLLKWFNLLIFDMFPVTNFFLHAID